MNQCLRLRQCFSKPIVLCSDGEFDVQSSGGVFVAVIGKSPTSPSELFKLVGLL